jgi:hypothetical protein
MATGRFVRLVNICHPIRVCLKRTIAIDADGKRFDIAHSSSYSACSAISELMVFTGADYPPARSCRRCEWAKGAAQEAKGVAQQAKGEARNAVKKVVDKA